LGEANLKEYRIENFLQGKRGVKSSNVRFVAWFLPTTNAEKSSINIQDTVGIGDDK
jgi:hypothetical protein